VTLEIRATRSHPATTAVRKALPDTPCLSAMAKAAENVGGLKWRKAKWSVSSSSMLCDDMALQNAAVGEETLYPYPMIIDSPFSLKSRENSAAIRPLSVRDPPRATPR